MNAATVIVFAIGVLVGFALFPIVLVVTRDLQAHRARRRARARGRVSPAAVHALRQTDAGLGHSRREPASLSTPAAKGFGRHVRVENAAGSTPQVRRRADVDRWLVSGRS